MTGVSVSSSVKEESSWKLKALKLMMGDVLVTGACRLPKCLFPSLILRLLHWVEDRILSFLFHLGLWSTWQTKTERIQTANFYLTVSVGHESKSCFSGYLWFTVSQRPSNPGANRGCTHLRLHTQNHSWDCQLKLSSSPNETISMEQAASLEWWPVRKESRIPVFYD